VGGAGSGGAEGLDRAMSFAPLAPRHQTHARGRIGPNPARTLHLMIGTAALLCATVARLTLPACEATRHGTQAGTSEDGVSALVGAARSASALQQNIDSLTVALEAMTGEVKSCNAEEARRQAEISALRAQIRYMHLRQENAWLRAELVGTGAQESEVDTWLCARGIQPYEGAPCGGEGVDQGAGQGADQGAVGSADGSADGDEIAVRGGAGEASAAAAVEDAAVDPGVCSRIVHIRTPHCDEAPELRLATHRELEQCLETACELLPKWGIAQGLDASMHGKGYACVLEKTMSPDGQGESVCVSRAPANAKRESSGIAEAHDGLE